MKSMTGFGKSETAKNGRKLSIEIKTVNHRFLDINLREPRLLNCFDDEIRAQIKNVIARGRVDVYIQYAVEDPALTEFSVDMGIVGAYVGAATKISASTGIKNDLSISQLLQMPDVVRVHEKDPRDGELKSLLVDCIQSALDELMTAREREGAQLKADIVLRLDIIESLASKIESKEDDVVAEYKERLTERIAELTDSRVPDPQRLAQEVAYFADRCNITEETVRIKSHVTQMRNCASAQGPQGRNMDFIVQELNREFNTIGSKTQSKEILDWVLTGKGEIEKIREQIQNIE